MLYAKDMLDWTVADVGLWLSNIGLSALRPAFIENMVSGMSLMELDTDDLKSLGVTKIGERKTFLRALRQQMNATQPFDGSDSQSSKSGSMKSTPDEGSEDDSWETGSQRSSTSSHRSTGSSRSTGRRQEKTFETHRVKAYYADRAKVFDVERDSSLSELRKKVRKLFHHRLVVAWKDEDGDKIVLKHESDWSLCKRTSGQRVRLWCKPAATEASHKKQSELKTIASLSDPVITSDEHGVIVSVNPATETFFGYRATMLVGSKVNLLMTDDVGEQHDEYIRRYLQTGEKRVIGSGRQVTAQKRSGEAVKMFLTISESWNRARTERKFVATLQDMSHLTARDGGAGSSIGASAGVITGDMTAQFTILQNIMDMVIVINERGVIKFINTAAEEFFGVKAAAVSGKNVKMFMQGKDKREHDNYLERYKSTGKSVIIGNKGREVVVCLADGSLRCVHLTVSEQKFGSASLFTGVMRPIDEQKQQANDHHPLTIIEQLREVLDTLLVAAVVCDDHGRILAFNESAEELFGYRIVEVINKNVMILCPPEHAVHHDAYLQKWRETGEEHVFGLGRDLTAKTKAGVIIPIRLSVTKKVNEQGKFLVTGTFQRLD